jgi:hypothetical protein
MGSGSNVDADGFFIAGDTEGEGIILGDESCLR